MSQFFVNSGGGGSVPAVDHLTGNAGGQLDPTANNFNIVTANSTVVFSGAGSTLTEDFGLSNLALGSSLPSLTTGLGNVGFGKNVLSSVTSGQDNCGFGELSLQSLNIGNSNSCFGDGSGNAITGAVENSALGKNTLLACVTGSHNCAGGYGTLGHCNSDDNSAWGYSSCLQLTTGTLNSTLGAFSLEICQVGNNNTAIGYSALSLALGSDNTALGLNAGESYTGTESSNLMLQNNGVTGESNTIRIGTQGTGARQQNRAFLAGVTGVTVTASAPTAIDTNGQLSSLGFGTSTQVLTSNGPTTSPSWQAVPSSGGTVTSVTGTTNRVTSTGGTTPVIDISAAYVGQSSITTLGTVSTGTWNGTNVAVANGGTGVSTITGIVSGNGTSNLVGRTITGTANQLTVTNGSGATANPTLSLPSAISFPGTTQAPLQPSFLAYLNTQDINITGNGTTYTLGSGNVLTKVFDQGTNFSTSGVFTAPLTGRYFLQYTQGFGALTSAMTSCAIRIVTSNNIFLFSNFSTGAVMNSSSVYIGTGSVFCDMDAGDVATFTCVIGNGAGNVVTSLAPVSGSIRTFVSGHLVC